jgi:hypothetical protein
MANRKKMGLNFCPTEHTFLSWIVSWVIARLLGENKLYFSIHVRLWQGCNLAFLKQFSKEKINWTFGYFLAFWNYICPTLAFFIFGTWQPCRVTFKQPWAKFYFEFLSFLLDSFCCPMVKINSQCYKTSRFFCSNFSTLGVCVWN